MKKLSLKEKLEQEWNYLLYLEWKGWDKLLGEPEKKIRPKEEVKTNGNTNKEN